MLSSIYIESLFEVYTYTLDLKPDEACFRFITGPNGYGKTTILNMLNALYAGNITALASIPFKTFRLAFDNHYEVVVEQRRDYAIEEDSDEKTDCQVSLHAVFKKKDNNSLLYEVNWDSDEEPAIEKSLATKGLSLYFQSHPIYYIRDGRILTPDGMPAVKAYAGILEDLLSGKLPKTDEFEKCLEVFRDIINNSQFAHKRMHIDERYGFRFVADNEEQTILPVEKLSSGEQHILIMAFELLFLAPDDSLVLIDEPEMSFHMLWQVDYLKNLRAITSLRKLQCIICTHSPQIFNQNWDLTIDLYDQSTING